MYLKLIYIYHDRPLYIANLYKICYLTYLFWLLSIPCLLYNTWQCYTATPKMPNGRRCRQPPWGPAAGHSCQSFRARPRLGGRRPAAGSPRGTGSKLASNGRARRRGMHWHGSGLRAAGEGTPALAASGAPSPTATETPGAGAEPPLARADSDSRRPRPACVCGPASPMRARLDGRAGPHHGPAFKPTPSVRRRIY